MSDRDEEFRRISAEQLQNDRVFYTALASALGHYATIMSYSKGYDLHLEALGSGWRDPLIAETLRIEVHRRLALELEKNK